MSEQVLILDARRGGELARALAARGCPALARAEPTVELLREVDALVLTGPDASARLRALRLAGHTHRAVLLGALPEDEARAPLEPLDTLPLEAGAAEIASALARLRAGALRGTLQLGALRVDLARRLVSGPRGVQELSPREADLLAYLAARAGRDVPREELLAQVWGHRRIGETRAVDMAVLRLRKKVEPDPSRPSLILASRGDGYRLVLPDPPAPPAPAPPAPRPVPALGLRLIGPLLGRAPLMDELARALAAGERVIGLVGPPGVGKTRLACELAREQLEAGGRGAAWRLDLSQASGLAELCLAAAAALDIETGEHPDARRALGGIGHALARRPRPLLILDRVEHVQDAVAEAVGALTDAAPELAVLICSQVRPELPLDRVLAVPSLAVEEAIALFRDRARRAGAPEPRPEHEPTLAALVELLDGLPLAVELAAARARLMTPPELLARLRRDQGLLSGERGGRGALADTLGWAWELLGPSEREAVWALSVFEGGFSREAALSVLGPDGEEALAVLIDRALIVRPVEAEDGEPRLGLLHALRAFALERHGPPADEVRARHAARFVDFCEELSRGRGQAGARRALERLDREAANLRVAGAWLERAGSPGQVPVLLAQAELHGSRGAHDACLLALDRALAACALAPERTPGVLNRRARALLTVGQIGPATADVERGVALLEGTPPCRARVELYGTRAEACRASARLVERARWLTLARQEAEAAGLGLLALAYRALERSSAPFGGGDLADVEGGLAEQREAWQRLHEAGELVLGFTVLGGLVSSLDILGEYPEALRLRLLASERQAVHRMPGWDDYWQLQAGMGLLRAHRFEEAASVLEAVTTGCAVSGRRGRQSFGHYYLATALLHGRRYDEAAANWLRLRELGGQEGQGHWRAAGTTGLVQLALDRGLGDEALALIDDEQRRAGPPADPRGRESMAMSYLRGMALGMLARWEEAERAFALVGEPSIIPDLRLAVYLWSAATAVVLGRRELEEELRGQMAALLAAASLVDRASWRLLMEQLDQRRPDEGLRLLDGQLTVDGLHSSHYLRLGARAPAVAFGS